MRSPRIILVGGERRALAFALLVTRGAVPAVIPATTANPDELRDPVRVLQDLALEFYRLLVTSAPVVVLDRTLTDLLAGLTGEDLVAVRRPLSRLLNRFSVVMLEFQGPAAEVEHQVELALATGATDQYAQLPAALDPHLRNFAGHVQGSRYLFLGDRTNPNLGHETWPFFGATNSSRFLSLALERVGIPEYRICWVNLNGTNGVALATAAMMRNPDLVPVLLGKEAAATWDKRHLQAFVTGSLRPIPPRLYHPQYYRRFHATDHQLDRDLQRLVEEYP